MTPSRSTSTRAGADSTRTPPPINSDVLFTSVYLLTPAIMVADLARLGNDNAKAMLTGFRDRLLQIGKACDYIMAEVWLRDSSKQRRTTKATRRQATCTS